MRRTLQIALWLLVTCVVPVRGGVTPEVDPSTATVGDPISVRLTIETDDGRVPVPRRLGPEIGPFTVLEESWIELPAEDAGVAWVWSATVAAYETGEQEFPELTIDAAGGAEGWSSDPAVVEVVSVLDEPEVEGEPVEIADLKGPASLVADFTALWLAGAVLLGLLFIAGLLWWLNRRYAARLAAAPRVEDPFARIAPHEWAYERLRELLEAKGRYSTDHFYEQLAWILKRYLGGRYRLDLLEATTDEVRPLLEQAGTPTTASAKILGVLTDCDAVKFAKYDPSDGERKEIVERVYGIIDQTRPVEQKTEPEAQEGAA